ncbi:V-set and transmembrane domain-containing protein 2-like protein, partial [Marmota marmota marmota]|uniref:V-set and transmembrane domain-containing protein 2-like protein n=1 Tax=Marmota marmota marmota TaxID=9994 RepID=UPI002093B3EE
PQPYFAFYLETGSHRVAERLALAEAGLELAILLPRLLSCWGCRRAPPAHFPPLFVCNLTRSRAHLGCPRGSPRGPPRWAGTRVAPPAPPLPRADGSRSLCRPQVVKVVGSNISHKLRLSRVKPTDEGTYECRVIDFSDGKARHHKVKAYLRVQPGENSVLHLPEAPPAAPAPPPP